MFVRKEPSGSAPNNPGAPATPSITDISLHVFYRLCEHIKNHFLDVEGIFRISGAVDEVRSVRDMLAKDPKMPLTYQSANPNATAHLYASVLTSFLREQPTSLLPFTMYDELCYAQAVYNGKTTAPQKKDANEGAAGDIPPPTMSQEECQKRGLEMFQTQIDQLPQHNKLLLHCLIDLLNGVSKHSDKNKMTASNLGVVFGPTLVKKENEDLMSIMTMTDRCDVVSTIIRNYNKLFPNPPNPQQYTSEGQGSLLRQSTRHSMSRKSRSPSFSSSKVHDKWFESFPGFQSARTLLAQAEAVVETQMAAESEAQKRQQRQTVDPQALAVAMKLSGSSGAAQTLQKELEGARDEAHRSSLALSQVIIKLVEIIREKAALEDENARLYARLETELSRKGYLGSSGEEQAAAENGGEKVVKNRMVADVVKRVDELKSEDFAFEPHDVMKKLDILQARMVHGCAEALPTRVDKTLVAVSNTIKRSADVVQSLQTSSNSGADFVKQLLDESSQQLQQIAKDIELTRTRMSAVAEREIGATAHSIMAYACGEEKPEDFTANPPAKEEAPAEQKKGPPPQSDLMKAMAVLGITITHVDEDGNEIGKKKKKEKKDDASDSDSDSDSDSESDSDDDTESSGKEDN